MGTDVFGFKVYYVPVSLVNFQNLNSLNFRRAKKVFGMNVKLFYLPPISV